MKLKTLKDIDMMYEGTPQGEEQLKEDLKAEAIKWVKIMKNPIKDRRVGVDIVGYYHKEVSWIKHFFNITEDDLK